MIKGLSAILLVFMMLGCVRTKHLGFFSIDPFAKPFDKPVDEPLNIVLMDEVKDQFLVEGNGAGKLNVDNFRRSVQDALQKTFSKNFKTINFSEQKSEKGLALVVYRIKPYWKLGALASDVINTAGVPVSVSSSSYSIVFQFDTSLYRNNKKINNADYQSVSTEMTEGRYSQRVFQDGLRVACETLNKMIFTDTIVESF